MAEDTYPNYSGQISGLSDQLTQLQNVFNSGNVMTAGDDGLMTVAGGTNQYGQIRPDTVLMRDASGNLDPRFMQTMSPEYQKLQAMGMAEGDTEAAALAREQQGLMHQSSMDSLQQQGASALGGSMRNLAMRGGAGLGSRERMNRDVSRSMMAGNQGINKENRLANLAISQQDQEMKNQLMGQTGMVGQQIQEGNINRLATDVQNQNMAMQNMYSEDMSAYGAQKSADAQAAAACFSGDTEFKLEDGTMKPIFDIELGDILFEGGEVFFKANSFSEDMYRINGVLVSGSHAIKENGEKWVRVADAKGAEEISGRWVVFNLGCKNHIMNTANEVFSDFFETDDYEQLTIEESLDRLNETLG